MYEIVLDENESIIYEELGEAIANFAQLSISNKYEVVDFYDEENILRARYLRENRLFYSY